VEGDSDEEADDHPRNRLALSYVDVVPARKTPGVRVTAEELRMEELVRKGQDLKRQIPGLHISRAYKLFLQDKAKKLRLPHYLASPAPPAGEHEQPFHCRE
jgi:hypothetical protein